MVDEMQLDHGPLATHFMPHKRNEVASQAGKFHPEIDELRSEAMYQAAWTTGHAKAQVADVPTGKSLHIRTLVISNLEATLTTYIFYEGSTGTTVKLHVQVGATGTLFVTDMNGIVFADDVYVDPDQFTNGSYMTIGGILESNDM